MFTFYITLTLHFIYTFYYTWLSVTSLQVCVFFFERLDCPRKSTVRVENEQPMTFYCNKVSLYRTIQLNFLNPFSIFF